LPTPDLDVEAAIFLFKSDAGECSRRIWNLVALLRETGLHVEMQRFENPGKIVYEDAYQIAVIPWRSQPEL